MGFMGSPLFDVIPAGILPEFLATLVLLTPGTKTLPPDNLNTASAKIPVMIEAYLFILDSGRVYPPITVLTYSKEDAASSIEMVLGEKS